MNTKEYNNHCIICLLSQSMINILLTLTFQALEAISLTCFQLFCLQPITPFAWYSLCAKMLIGTIILVRGRKRSGSLRRKYSDVKAIKSAKKRIRRNPVRNPNLTSRRCILSSSYEPKDHCWIQRFLQGFHALI